MRNFISTGYHLNYLFYCLTSCLVAVERKGPTNLQMSISFPEKLFHNTKRVFFKCLKNEKSFPCSILSQLCLSSSISMLCTSKAFTRCFKCIRNRIHLICCYIYIYIYIYKSEIECTQTSSVVMTYNIFSKTPT